MSIKDRKVYLPNGTRINYDTLSYQVDAENGGGQWELQLRTGRTKMYGAKMVENVVQALSRVILSDGMIRLNRAGFRPVLTSHDEVAVLVKQEQAQEAIDFCLNEMTRTPAWLPELPLAAEYVIGMRYEK